MLLIIKHAANGELIILNQDVDSIYKLGIVVINLSKHVRKQFDLFGSKNLSDTSYLELF